MSDGGGDAAGDDLSGLGGFFFYVFIVHPATAWILRPGRFERKKSIMYAIAFLAALAAIKTGETSTETRFRFFFSSKYIM
jgi:hypothetical protein